jgi:hypothetical protein
VKIRVFWDATRCLLVGKFGRWLITAWLSLLELHGPEREGIIQSSGII